LVRNGTIVPCLFQSADELLSSLQTRAKALPYAYSTARTVNANCVLDLEAHFDRLGGVAEILNKSKMTTEEVCILVQPSLARALNAFFVGSAQVAVRTATVSATSAEARLTLLLGDLGHHGKPYDVIIFAEPLPPSPAWPVQLELRPGARDAPTLKTSNWVAARRHFKEQKFAESDEVILLGDDGRCYEGLSSIS